MFFGTALTEGSMHQRARAFRDRVIEEYEIEPRIEEFPDGTETAADAAEAIGCEVGAIASSLVFSAAGDLVVVVTSGANHVDEPRLAVHLGVDTVSMADPAEIEAQIGWAVGGVPPLCHDADVPVYLDDTLLEYDTVWAAAGAPTAVFPIDPERLRQVTDATTITV